MSTHLDLVREAAENARARSCAYPVVVQTASGDEYFTRCGTSQASKCQACARVYYQDVHAIARSGVFDLPTDRRYRWLLLTLTAPGADVFGATHRVVTAGRRVTPRDRCRCGVIHDPERDAALRGVPIDLDTYAYDEVVRWNRDSARLLNASLQVLRNSVGSVPYLSVREMQERGLAHYHIIFRFDAAEFPNPALLVEQLRGVVSAGLWGDLTEWGEQIDAREIAPGRNLAQSMAYVVKAVSYAVKDIAGKSSPVAREHHRRLEAAARAMHCKKCQHLSDRCGGRAHRRWGATSRVVSWSKGSKDGTHPGWSLTDLTREKQQQARREWAEKYGDGHREYGQRLWRIATNTSKILGLGPPVPGL